MKHKGPHKYHKIPAKYISVWSCALPDCNHHMPLHMEHLLEGKATLCWHCNEPAIMDAESMQCLSTIRDGVLEPLCDKCRFEQKTGMKADLDKLAELLNEN